MFCLVLVFYFFVWLVFFFYLFIFFFWLIHLPTLCNCRLLSFVFVSLRMQRRDLTRS